MFIRGVMEPIEELRQHYSDVFYIFYGRRPVEELAREEAQSTFWLRCETEVILELMVQDVQMGLVA